MNVGQDLGPSSLALPVRSSVSSVLAAAALDEVRWVLPESILHMCRRTDPSIILLSRHCPLSSVSSTSRGEGLVFPSASRPRAVSPSAPRSKSPMSPLHPVALLFPIPPQTRQSDVRADRSSPGMRRTSSMKRGSLNLVWLVLLHYTHRGRGGGGGRKHPTAAVRPAYIPRPVT